MSLILLLQLFFLASVLADSATATGGRQKNLYGQIPKETWGVLSPPAGAAGVTGGLGSAGVTVGSGSAGVTVGSGSVGVTGGSGSAGTEFLQAHNKARRSAGHPPLKWDKNLATFARRWTHRRQSDCKMVHSGGPYGENLFLSETVKDWPPAEVVKNWVAEKRNYIAETNSCVAGKMCGHYTQVMWRKTSAVGCARVRCDNNMGYLVACEYDPPGNYDGETPFSS